MKLLTPEESAALMAANELMYRANHAATLAATAEKERRWATRPDNSAIHSLLKRGVPVQELADMCGLSVSRIRFICRREEIRVQC